MTNFQCIRAPILFLYFILTACGPSSEGSRSEYFSIGGTLSGSNETISLINDSGFGTNIDVLSLAKNGAYRFDYSPQSGNFYHNGSNYSISLATQPIGQVCKIENSEGVINYANISNIDVSCTSSPEVILNNFTGRADGFYPDSGVSMGSDDKYYGVTSYGGVYDAGTFYRYDPLTSQKTVLYSFGGTSTDGRNPESGLTQACDGNWYGVTVKGGTNGFGTFYKMTSTGYETVLYSFDGANGATPQGLTIDDTSCPNLNPVFYGTTTYGGANSLGAVYSMTITGTQTLLYSFGSSATDGIQPAAGMSRSSDGNYYGTTYSGGSYDLGTFFKISPLGAYTQLYSFGNGAADGQYPDQKPRQGADGYFYGTTSGGGSNGFGAIYKLSPITGSETVFYSFKGGSTDGRQPSSRLRIGADGNFYGVTFYGGTFNLGTLYKITPLAIETLIYSFAGSASNDGQYPNSSLLQSPDGSFIGTTTLGGANNSGTLFKITTK